MPKLSKYSGKGLEAEDRLVRSLDDIKTEELSLNTHKNQAIYTNAEIVKIRSVLNPVKRKTSLTQDLWLLELQGIVKAFLIENDIKQTAVRAVTGDDLERLIKVMKRNISLWAELWWDYSVFSSLENVSDAVVCWRVDTEVICREAEKQLNELSLKKGRPKGKVANQPRKKMLKRLMKFYEQYATLNVTSKTKENVQLYDFIETCLSPLENLAGEKPIWSSEALSKEIRRILNL